MNLLLPVSLLLYPPLPLLQTLLLVHPLDQLVQGLFQGKKLQLIGGLVEMMDQPRLKLWTPTLDIEPSEGKLGLQRLALVQLLKLVEQPP